MDDEFALFAAEIGELEQQAVKDHSPAAAALSTAALSPSPGAADASSSWVHGGRAATIAKAPAHVPAGPSARPNPMTMQPFNRPPPPPPPAAAMYAGGGAAAGGPPVAPTWVPPPPPPHAHALSSIPVGPPTATMVGGGGPQYGIPGATVPSQRPQQYEYSHHALPPPHHGAHHGVGGGLPGAVYPPGPPTMSTTATTTAAAAAGGGSSGGVTTTAIDRGGTTAAAPGAELKRAGGAEKPEVKKIGTPVFRQAGGDRWEDKSLGEWPENDHRIFVGDLGAEVNDDLLAKAFAKYPTFQKAKVIKDKSSGKSKGFGFVSLMDPSDYAKAMKEMNGRYIGNRPCKLKKSDWASRNDTSKVKNKVAPKRKPTHKRKHLPTGPSGTR